MLHNDKIKKTEFIGPLKNVLTSFLDEMRLTGRVYGSESFYLTKIDQGSMEANLAQNTLPQNFVEKWSAKREHESIKTWSNRSIVIRKLARYMQEHDLEAYVLPSLPHKQRSDFVPHIYTNDELRRLFEQADLIPAYPNCPNRNAVSSLIFRMIYGCGLRISEALNLTMKDVDIDNCVLSIKNSKFGVNRFVPMTVELTERCRSYVNKARCFAEQNEPFFQAPDGGYYSRRGINSMFRQILFSAGIPYTGKGPRIHDLRHTFAVNCLKRWIREKKDLNAMLPVLSIYLGHKGISGTQNYLRLTADMFPNITESLERMFEIDIFKGGDINES